MFKEISDKIGIQDYRRFRWFFWILVFCLFYLLIVFIFRTKFFYTDTIDGFKNIYRLFWVLPFSFMGFSFLALLFARAHKSGDKPWLSYIFSYFPRLIAVSLIIFSVLHLFDKTSGYLYYFFSSGLGLYVGYNIDRFSLEDILKKMK